MKIIMRSFSLPLLVWAISGCGGDDIDTIGKLSIELLGNGLAEVTAPGIQCPGTCETEVVFPQSQASSTIEFKKTTKSEISAETGSEFLWWLVSESLGKGETIAGSCEDNSHCSVSMSTLCGVAVFPPVCTANTIIDFELRPVVEDKSLLVDWDQSGRDVCVLRKNGEAQCWEGGPRYYRYFEETVPPAFVSPKDISVNNDYACALDQTGVHCWGETGEQVEREPSVTFGLQYSEQVAVLAPGACALGNNELTCWSTSDNPENRGLLDLPAFNQPNNLRRQNNTLCVDDSSETICWFWHFREQRLEVVQPSS